MERQMKQSKTCLRNQSTTSLTHLSKKMMLSLSLKSGESQPGENSEPWLGILSMNPLTICGISLRT